MQPYQPDANQESSTSTQTGAFEAANVLALSDTRRIIIEDFALSLCGLQNVINHQGETVVKRFTKPTFTYEFVQQMISTMYMMVNLITVRTTFDDEQIRQYLFVESDALKLWYGSEGIRNLVSPKIWSYAESEDWEEHGISWSRHDFFNVDMLNILKDKYDLHNESYGQDMILRHVFWAMMEFIHGGMNKSLHHLTLDHEKVIYKETFVGNPTGEKNRNEGVLDGVKRRLNLWRGS